MGIGLMIIILLVILIIVLVLVGVAITTSKQGDMDTLKKRVQLKQLQRMEKDLDMQDLSEKIGQFGPPSGPMGMPEGEDKPTPVGFRKD